MYFIFQIQLLLMVITKQQRLILTYLLGIHYDDIKTSL